MWPRFDEQSTEDTLFSLILWSAVLLPVPLCRVALSDHTSAQVFLGTIEGVLCASIWSRLGVCLQYRFNHRLGECVFVGERKVLKHNMALPLSEAMQLILEELKTKNPSTISNCINQLLWYERKTLQRAKRQLEDFIFEDSDEVDYLWFRWCMIRDVLEIACHDDGGIINQVMCSPNPNPLDVWKAAWLGIRHFPDTMCNGSATGSRMTIEMATIASSAPRLEECGLKKLTPKEHVDKLLENTLEGRDELREEIESLRCNLRIHEAVHERNREVLKVQAGNISALKKRAWGSVRSEESLVDIFTQCVFEPRRIMSSTSYGARLPPLVSE